MDNDEVLLMDDTRDTARMIVMVMRLMRWLNNDRDDVKVTSMAADDGNEEGDEYSDYKAPGPGRR